MKKQPSKQVLKSGNKKIIKSYDWYGNWEYILIENEQTIQRSNNFEELKREIYAWQTIDNNCIIRRRPMKALFHVKIWKENNNEYLWRNEKCRSRDW